MSKWAQHQPKHGDVIIHCGHLEHGRCCHWWLIEGFRAKRPDGSIIAPKWAVCCDDCFNMSAGDMGKVNFRADGTWRGNDPFIPAGN